MSDGDDQGTGRRRGAPARRRPRRSPDDAARATRSEDGAGPRERSGPREPRRRDPGPALARRAEARAGVVVPPITYPEQLPVSARRADIAAAIRDHQVVIVAGETGSGKTTQIPKIALELGRGRAGQIGHTQPRRLAARTVAERISEELTGGPGALGSIVGYQVRFTDQSSEETLVKVMTDGILLAQIQHDPLLLAYDTLIIDEAHERSLNIDFLLGYLTRLLPRRPDLKVVITSATIDSDRFARHFAGPPTAEHPDGVPAPVVEVTGRTYPVEIRYRPLAPDEDDAAEARGEAVDEDAPRRKPRRTGPRTEPRDLMTAICEAVDELSAEGPGDILVFLSGEREIRDAEDALRSHLGPRAVGPGHVATPRSVEILPLYARLSAAEQHRVFAPHPGRRVVLATNVAETSLTVPGVRYVVDPGTARISRWSKATKVQRLPIEPVSQASANQRSGRCGRVADGVAIRLYSEADFASRPEFTEPEILRTSLASVILQMISVGVAASPEDVTAFPFVEPPDTRSVRDGVALLTELAAIEQGRDGSTRLTPTGRALARLPIDPRLARMIVEAGKRGVAREVMVIAAALTIQDPRERPLETRPQADQAHARFADPTSDFLTYLNLYAYVRERQRALSSSAFRRLCRAEHLNYLRLREWQDLVTQVRELAKPLGIPVAPPARGGTEPDPEGHDLRRDWDAEAIHRSILAGLLSQIGMLEVTDVKVGARGRGAVTARPDRRAMREYLGARGARFAIFPGSPLSKRPPAWIMAAEVVETSRLWARDVARIEPEWAEEPAAHLVRRVYAEPRWSSKRGAAVVEEKVLLYGVPLVAARTVLLAKVDPVAARDLFIRHALVEGDWTTHHRFFHANRELLAEATELEHRTRTRGLVVDDETLVAFYEARVGAEVVSARHFDTWWRTARRATPDLLDFDRAMLVREEVDTADFPTVWPHGDLELALTYQYVPGAATDGVTVHVPVAVLDRVRPEGFDWLVPGLHLELATALIRTLPKAIRVQLVPAPDVAREVVARIHATTASWEDTVRAADAAPSFHEAFAASVRALRGVEIPPEAWDDDKLPDHLRITFRVVEDRGSSVQLLDEGPDLPALQRRLTHRSRAAVRTAVRDAVRAAVADGGAADATGDAGAAGAPGGAGGAGSGSGSAGGSGGGPRPGPGAGGVGRARPGADLERTGLTTWPADLTELPEVLTAVAGGLPVEAFPSLVAEPGGVALRVLTTAAERDRRHPAAVRELLLTDLALPTGRVTSRWSAAQALALGASPYPTTDALVRDLQRAALAGLLARRGSPVVRDAATYAALRTALRDELEDETFAVADRAAQVLVAHRELDADLRATSSLALLSTVHDLRRQSRALVGDGFVGRTGDRLTHLVRYLRAARHRLAKAAENPGRDEALAWQVAEVEEAVTAATDAARAAPPDADRDARLERARWLVEELRVSLFAQQLGTAEPVSAKRIRALL